MQNDFSARTKNFRSTTPTSDERGRTHLVEEPAAAGITGAAVGDVGEPDGFFWSSSEDSKDVCPVCLRGRPSDNLLEAALVLQTLFYITQLI